MGDGQEEDVCDATIAEKLSVADNIKITFNPLKAERRRFRLLIKSL
jgi:hypothetical protein